jgi:hypothetical protein
MYERPYCRDPRERLVYESTSRFALLSTPAGADWAEAARQAAARRGLELATYTIGADGDFQEDGDWAKL